MRPPPRSTGRKRLPVSSRSSPKRGQTGQARWTAQTEQGVAKLHAFGPTEGFRGRPLKVPQSEDQAPPIGQPDDPAFMFIDPYLRTGYRQKYMLSVNGGLEDLSYFISGSWGNEEGVLPEDYLNKATVRGNFTASPLDNLTLDLEYVLFQDRNRPDSSWAERPGYRPQHVPTPEELPRDHGPGGGEQALRVRELREDRPSHHGDDGYLCAVSGAHRALHRRV